MEWFVFMAHRALDRPLVGIDHPGCLLDLPAKNKSDKDEELVVLELSVTPVWPCGEDGSDAAVVGTGECHAVVKVVDELILILLELDVS